MFVYLLYVFNGSSFLESAIYYLIFIYFLIKTFLIDIVYLFDSDLDYAFS